MILKSPKTIVVRICETVMLVQFFRSSIFWVHCFSNLLRHWQAAIWLCSLLCANQFQHFSGQGSFCWLVFVLRVCSKCSSALLCTWFCVAVLRVKFIFFNRVSIVVFVSGRCTSIHPFVAGLTIFDSMSHWFIGIFLAPIHSHTRVRYIECFLSRFPISASISVIVSFLPRSVFLPQFLFDLSISLGVLFALGSFDFG